MWSDVSVGGLFFLFSHVTCIGLIGFFPNQLSRVEFFRLVLARSCRRFPKRSVWIVPLPVAGSVCISFVSTSIVCMGGRPGCRPPMLG